MDRVLLIIAAVAAIAPFSVAAVRDERNGFYPTSDVAATFLTGLPGNSQADGSRSQATCTIVAAMSAMLEPTVPTVGEAPDPGRISPPPERRPTVARSTGADPLVEIVVPVHNEERVLVDAIGKLHAYLTATFPFPWHITIADNASTDATSALARALARTLPGVEAMHLSEKGRGRALRAAWSRSRAEVVAYVDADLSTDLDALWPLVAPLVSGHSGIAIGTRLASGARVERGPKREVISRCYNLILHTVLGVRFSDAQCGFKAVRRDVARALVPMIADQSWFFDTELLVLAERNGIRIHEVPVDWVDDPDSSVDIAATAVADLRGVVRLLRTFAHGGGRLDAVRVATLRRAHAAGGRIRDHTVAHGGVTA